MKAGEWVYLGFVEKVHGLRGRMVARLVLAGAIGPVAEGSVLRLEDTKHRVVRSTVRDSERIILQFEDLFSKEQADEMRGMSIYMRGSSISPGEGLLPLHAFIGMEVRSGCFSGTVAEVEPSRTNPQLLVKGEKGLFPVPLTMIAAGETDWESGVIEIDLPEGLQDMVVER